MATKQTTKGGLAKKADSIIATMELVNDPLGALEARIGYSFKQRKLLEAALTSPTWLNENRHAVEAGIENDYERLEFLGDSIIGRSVALALFEEKDSSLNPEAMTKLRSALVNQTNCLRIGNELKLEPLIRMGRAPKRSAIADCVEALVGAVHQDGGLDAAEQVVKKLFLAEGFVDNAQKVHDSQDVYTQFLIFYQGMANATLPKPEFIKLKKNPPFVFQAKWSRAIMEKIGVPQGVTATGKSHKFAKRELAAKALRLATEHVPPSSGASHQSQSSKVFYESPMSALLERGIANPTSTFNDIYQRRFRLHGRCPNDIVTYGLHENKTMATLSLADFHFDHKEISAVGPCKKDAKHAAIGWALLIYGDQLGLASSCMPPRKVIKRENEPPMFFEAD